MPTTWTFEPILRAFIVTSEGTAPLPEFFAVVEELLTHPRARDRMRLLFDNRLIPAPTEEFVRDGLQRLGHFADRLQHATIVFVVPGPGDHGIGRLAPVSNAGKLSIEVFNDMAAAVICLTMDDQD